MKKQTKMAEYKIRITTFRQYLQVFVWDLWEKEHVKYFTCRMWEDSSGNWNYNDQWFYAHLDDINANVIRLKKYDIQVLLHELMHFIGRQSKVIGFDATDEPAAYIMEEVFCKVMKLSKGKFKLDYKQLNEY